MRAYFYACMGIGDNNGRDSESDMQESVGSTGGEHSPVLYVTCGALAVALASFLLGRWSQSSKIEKMTDSSIKVTEELNRANKKNRGLEDAVTRAEREIEHWRELHIENYGERKKFDALIYMLSKNGYHEEVQDISGNSLKGNTTGDLAYLKYGIEKGFCSIKVHYIKPKETLALISKQYNVPIKEIIRTNNEFGRLAWKMMPIKDPNYIQRDRMLLIPLTNLEIGGKYKVKKGDRLWNIARKLVSPEYDKNSIPTKEEKDMYYRIVVLNRHYGELDDPDEIEVGQEILLPYRKKHVPETEVKEIVIRAIEEKMDYKPKPRKGPKPEEKPNELELKSFFE